MTAGEQGFLLLTGYLGDPEQRPLTTAQFRDLTKLARCMDKPDLDRDMTEQDLQAIGCSAGEAKRIVLLLSREEQLQWYVNRGKRRDCVPVTRISNAYPACLRQRLGMEAPGVLWSKGDLSLLRRPAVSLVGSRDLRPENMEFAPRLGNRRPCKAGCWFPGMPGVRTAPLRKAAWNTVAA